MSLKPSVVALVALGVGFGLGYLAFSGRVASKRSSSSFGSGSLARDTPDEDTDPTTGSSGSVGQKRPSGRLGAALLRQVRRRNVQLAAENKRLSSQVEELRQDRAFARGKPMAWPTMTPPRFEKKVLLRALNAALKETGLPGEITDVDCGEYPCVMAGTLQGARDKEVFGRLLRTRALAAYKNDHVETSLSTRARHDSLGRLRQRSYFSMAMLLAGPSGTELDVKRTIYRLRMLLDATTGL